MSVKILKNLHDCMWKKDKYLTLAVSVNKYCKVIIIIKHTLIRNQSSEKFIEGIPRRFCINICNGKYI